MNIPRKEDKSWHNFAACIRQNSRRVKEGKTPIMNLTRKRMKTLQQIDFEYEIPNFIPFESCIEALKLHQVKHGHINVSKKEYK